MNFIIFVLSNFRTELLTGNHLIVQERTKFNTKQKSLKFLLEIKTVVSSANNIDSNTEFILRGMSPVHIMNKEAPELMLGEIHF